MGPAMTLPNGNSGSVSDVMRQSADSNQNRLSNFDAQKSNDPRGDFIDLQQTDKAQGNQDSNDANLGDDGKSKRSYLPVGIGKKRALIQHVEDGMTIKEAAGQLGINYSTAKHIVKLYRSSKEARLGGSFLGSLGVIMPTNHFNQGGFGVGFQGMQGFPTGNMQMSNFMGTNESLQKLGFASLGGSSQQLSFPSGGNIAGSMMSLQKYNAMSAPLSQGILPYQQNYHPSNVLSTNHTSNNIGPSVSPNYLSLAQQAGVMGAMGQGNRVDVTQQQTFSHQLRQDHPANLYGQPQTQVQNQMINSMVSQDYNQPAINRDHLSIQNLVGKRSYTTMNTLNPSAGQINNSSNGLNYPQSSYRQQAEISDLGRNLTGFQQNQIQSAERGITNNMCVTTQSIVRQPSNVAGPHFFQQQTGMLYQMGQTQTTFHSVNPSTNFERKNQVMDVNSIQGSEQTTQSSNQTINNQFIGQRQFIGLSQNPNSNNFTIPSQINKLGNKQGDGAQQIFTEGSFKSDIGIRSDLMVARTPSQNQYHISMVDSHQSQLQSQVPFSPSVSNALIHHFAQNTDASKRLKTEGSYGAGVQFDQIRGGILNTNRHPSLAGSESLTMKQDNPAIQQQQPPQFQIQGQPVGAVKNTISFAAATSTDHTTQNDVAKQMFNQCTFNSQKQNTLPNSLNIDKRDQAPAFQQGFEQVRCEGTSDSHTLEKLAPQSTDTQNKGHNANFVQAKIEQHDISNIAHFGSEISHPNNGNQFDQERSNYGVNEGSLSAQLRQETLNSLNQVKQESLGLVKNENVLPAMMPSFAEVAAGAKANLSMHFDPNQASSSTMPLFQLQNGLTGKLSSIWNPLANSLKLSTAGQVVTTGTPSQATPGMIVHRPIPQIIKHQQLPSLQNIKSLLGMSLSQEAMPNYTAGPVARQNQFARCANQQHTSSDDKSSAAATMYGCQPNQNFLALPNVLSYGQVQAELESKSNSQLQPTQNNFENQEELILERSPNKEGMVFNQMTTKCEELSRSQAINVQTYYIESGNNKQSLFSTQKQGEEDSAALKHAQTSQQIQLPTFSSSAAQIKQLQEQTLTNSGQMRNNLICSSVQGSDARLGQEGDDQRDNRLQHQEFSGQLLNSHLHGNANIRSLILSQLQGQQEKDLQTVTSTTPQFVNVLVGPPKQHYSSVLFQLEQSKGSSSSRQSSVNSHTLTENSAK
ncbi:hypothetical protein FGO68_gene10981 [Halteria grandinella]|uniref:Uncharacterized protein n=1 Tax=Halteria grandinella TaxID=5974 RepID=A0A8J8T9E1_HALGN|nr:hypothetical protein FGO68_gene10981 [Halteria grandinella]